MATAYFSSPIVIAKPASPGNDSYYDVLFNAASPLGPSGTVLDGWCIQPLVRLDYNSGYVYSGFGYPGFEVAADNGFEQEGAINWLLNYYRSGTSGYSAQSVQETIWQLVAQDFSIPNGLADLALRHNDFVADAGQIIAVVIDPVTGAQIHDQNLIVETKAAKLGDRVWHDADADGVQDAGEAGIAGATVQLVRDVNGDGQFVGANEVLGTTTTDANGNYSFKGLTPGLSYQVRFVSPSGYDAASPRQVDGNAASGTDSDGALSSIIKLAPGEYNATVDSGFYKYVRIGDKVWIDTNGNGVQDTGEACKAGVKVELYTSVNGAPGTVVATQTTDANGNYSFTGLKPGDYVVKFTSADGTLLSTANVGNDAFDSDAGANGFTGTYTLSSGQVNTTADAGFKALTATLGDRVWNDANRNGLQDAGETGIANVGLKLYTVGADGFAGTADDVYTGKSTTTDGNGNYRFNDLAPGTYSVRLDGSGLNAATQDFTRRNVGGNDAVDSDVNIFNANRITGYTDAVTLKAGDYNTSVDIGVASRTGSIGDTVWFDKNGDGLQNDGNTGMAGILVTLRSAGADGTFGTGDDVALGNQLTDSNGKYLFTNVEAGNYRVVFNGLGEGQQFTTANYGANGYDTQDSDVVGLNGSTQTFTLAAGQDRTDIDAGIRNAAPVVAGKASLGDRVWIDANNNGVQDAGEAGKAGVVVKLLDATRYNAAALNTVNGDDMTQNAVIATTTTDANGNYQFTGLAAGQYQVRFMAVDGYEWSGKDKGADTVDSDVNINTGVTDVITLAAGQSNMTVDAGLHASVKGAVGDKVFWDFDHDGLQQANNPGWGNVRVSLQNASGQTIASMVTDTDGLYRFNNVEAGNYRVMFEKDGWNFAAQDVGTNDAIDADAYSTTNTAYTAYFALAAGQTDLTWDAGITPIVLDLDGNGIHTVSRFDAQGSFDLLGNGTAVKSGWISSGDAFLAVDNNHNGTIDSVSELFGGTAKGAGFAKLASFDSNGDGVVDAKDARFNELTVWRDANGNHVTDAGELMTLAQAGVDSLKVAHTDVPEIDAQGNLHLERSSATLAGGQQVDMTDVYFAVSGEDAKAEGLSGVSMADLLGDGSLDGVLGSVGSTQASAANDAATAPDYGDAAEVLRKLTAAMQAGNEVHVASA
ncbi:SdrD B-like domain-containing protein [Variovorax sp. dw_308]|uniref:SdrD B-like domain-containing protein n=1 Tax=Variovorax sp. dw_308 TaxID=2721546 RepID=UPI001C48615F|nr:SdrD B-like domain-containing protein [Variovorax sp. dw_308]